MLRTIKFVLRKPRFAVSLLLLGINTLPLLRVSAQFMPRDRGHGEVKVLTDRRNSPATPSLTPLSRRQRLCAKNQLCLRLLAEYGGMFAASTDKVLLPANSFFHNEAEVQRFQRRAGSLFDSVGGVRVELQPQALKAYLAARSEAKQRGLNISPRGTDSSRRSFADTVMLWRSRVNPALTYWVGRGKLTKREAEELRSLSLEEQVARVLAFETKHIYFGTGFEKSILQSVAAPGASQHNFMLALDVDQFNNVQVRAILAKHGWFQTVKNDPPHFTYLGVEESALPARGLKRDSSSGIRVWVPDMTVRPTVASIVGEKDSGNRQAAATTSKKTRETDEQEGDNESSSVTPKPGSGSPLKGTVGANVIVLANMKPLLINLTSQYFAASGNSLYITSAYRSPEAQARAMYHNLVAFGRAYVLGTYGGREAANDIIAAYRKNARSESKAIAAMTNVIQEQVERGFYISRHMRGKAFDIRLSSADEPILDGVVRSLGGRLAVEIDHYHVQF